MMSVQTPVQGMLPTLRAARPVIAAFAAMGVLWGCFAAVLPDLKTMLGVDEARLGLLLLFTPVAAVVAMLLAPAIGARLGGVALPVATAAMALAFALPGRMPDEWLFPLAMLCCGATTGLTDVLMNARTARIEQERKLHLMNLCHAFYSFGYALGAVGTGALRGIGWAPAPLMALMAALSLLLALGCLERDGVIRGLRRPVNAVAGLGPLPLIGGLIVLVAFLSENATESWSALHIEHTLGGSPTQGAMGPAALALTMGIARLFGQSLILRISPLTLIRGGASIAAVGALVAASAATPGIAYLGFVIMGIGGSVIAPTAFALVGRLARPEDQARAVARATLYGYFGYFFGPPGLGLLAGLFGLRAAFVAVALILLVVHLLVPLMARHQK